RHRPAVPPDGRATSGDGSEQLVRRRQHTRTTLPPAPAAPPPAVVPHAVPPPAAVPAGPPGPVVTGPADLEREAGVARLFELHYSSMLRLAVLLGADDPENVVAEAYYQIYRKWRRLKDVAAAEAYLRSTVCNLTRMRIRHLQVVRRVVPQAPPDDTVASAENTAL